MDLFVFLVLFYGLDLPHAGIPSIVLLLAIAAIPGFCAAILLAELRTYLRVPLDVVADPLMGLGVSVLPSLMLPVVILALYRRDRSEYNHVRRVIRTRTLISAGIGVLLMAFFQAHMIYKERSAVQPQPSGHRPPIHLIEQGNQAPASSPVPHHFEAEEPSGTIMKYDCRGRGQR